jgi:hypothetical protein
MHLEGGSRDILILVSRNSSGVAVHRHFQFAERLDVVLLSAKHRGNFIFVIRT